MSVLIEYFMIGFSWTAMILGTLGMWVAYFIDTDILQVIGLGALSVFGFMMVIFVLPHWHE
jgi:Na+-translocating ferredoxin:NAD+ oxidoreductase RnfA subunit